VGTENAAKPQPTALYHVWWLQTVLTCYSTVTARMLESRLSGAGQTSSLGSCDLYLEFLFGIFFDFCRVCVYTQLDIPFPSRVNCTNSVPQTLSLAAMNERCAEQAGARIYVVTKLKKRLQIAIYMHIKMSTAIQCSRGRGQRDQAWAWGVKPDVWRQIPDLSGKSYCSSNMATGVFLYCIAYCTVRLLYVLC